MKKREDLRILLIQLRKDAETIDDELTQFAKHTGLKEGQFEQLLVFTADGFDINRLNEFDALFVGGSSDDGDALLVETPPVWAQLAMDVLQAAYDLKMPVFASCFGFQAAVRAFGGELAYDKDLDEFGTLPFELTPEAKDDVLFRDTPESFAAVVGHKKYATKLPEGAVNLVKSSLCPFQSFKFEDRPFYGFQYHPELTKELLVEWLTRYKDRYFKTEEEYQKAVTGHVEVPESNAFLTKFVERILLA